MPEIEIRPFTPADIPILTALDHHYSTDQVWQMEFRHERELGQIITTFRRVRLPRTVRIEYPRSPQALETGWADQAGILVAVFQDNPVGYVTLMLNMSPMTAWATNLVVDQPMRRMGIGSALVLAAMEWAAQMGTANFVLEMQPKNHPAIQMAVKLGFEFCGYNDRYYASQEIGIFFGKSLR